jgi:putative colanic acid biosynthesis acetyltransferase WcaF
MISAPIRIGSRAWICARAVVQMGVTVGEGAILGLGAIATRDLEPWSIYAGIPARKIKARPKC